MTVVDTSAVIDYLLGEPLATDLEAVLTTEGVIAAPDVLVFEVLAVLRRQALAGVVAADRAQAAVDDLGDLSVELYPVMPLSSRAWELRQNFTIADALFIALAERLGEPFMTKDHALASAARLHTSIHVIDIGGGAGASD